MKKYSRRLEMEVKRKFQLNAPNPREFKKMFECSYRPTVI